MAMTDMIAEIMVEVLTVLAIMTKEVKRGQFSELISFMFMRLGLTHCLERYLKLRGNSDLGSSLERLDRLTPETRMAPVELLKMTRSVDGSMIG